MSDLSRFFGFGHRSSFQQLEDARLQSDGIQPDSPRDGSLPGRKPRPLPRMASYLSFASSKDGDKAPPPTPGTPQPAVDWDEASLTATSIASQSSNSDSFMFAEQDQTWERPSLDQMAETLLCEIMKAGPVKPIPVRLNSYVLHLIEGIRNLQTEKEKNGEANTARERDLEQFKDMSNEWIAREHLYKAEIRRLEKLLARHSKDGMETVAIARSNTLINRSDTKRFISQIHRVSGGGGTGTSKPATPISLPRLVLLALNHYLASDGTVDGAKTPEDHTTKATVEAVGQKKRREYSGWHCQPAAFTPDIQSRPDTSHPRSRSRRRAQRLLA